MTETLLATTIDRARRELHVDAREGIICRQCATDEGFGYLHTVVDANGYGGGVSDGPDNPYPFPVGPDDYTDAPEVELWAHVDFWNAVQDGVAEWLHLGGLMGTTYAHGHPCASAGCGEAWRYCKDIHAESGEAGYCERIDFAQYCPSHAPENGAPVQAGWY